MVPPLCNSNASEVQSFWEVPVARYHVPKTVTQTLTQVLCELAKTRPGVRKSNRGGWHSGALLDALTTPAATRLRSAFFSAGSDYIRRVDRRARAGLRGEVKLSLLGAWANVNKHGDSNVAHMHPGLVSGVLYIETDLPQGATLCFTDPRAIPSQCSSQSCDSFGQEEWNENCSLLGDSVNGAAFKDLTAGEMLIFPSWLQHHVPPHAGKDLRISVAFNLKAELVQQKKTEKILTITVDQDLRFDAAAAEFRTMELLFGSQVTRKDASIDLSFDWLHEGDLRRFRPPDQVASWIRSSGTLSFWSCFRTPGEAGSVSVVVLPENFVQGLRYRPSVLAANSGFHVLAGDIKLWLHDPRLQVEVAAAADPIARHLFGQKVALQLTSGTMVAFPASVFYSLEAKVPSATLALTL
ncbi:Uncharacterized protein SCF082_LOCUS1063 [Durusdinium trenchii]|uniref:JmjC domain-containing protein n=1 Tax=Durusdinium trenchii TaxID=1381693 RepID=A0ABP0HCL5_9DINO